MPATKRKYWTKKIARDKKRDKEVNHHYKKIGWKIIRVWEHDIKKNTNKCFQKIIVKLQKQGYKK